MTSDNREARKRNRARLETARKIERIARRLDASVRSGLLAMAANEYRAAGQHRAADRLETASTF
jgi:hypothetical protein